MHNDAALVPPRREPVRTIETLGPSNRAKQLPIDAVLRRRPLQANGCLVGTHWDLICLVLLDRKPHGRLRRSSLNPPGPFHKRGTQLHTKIFRRRCGGTCSTHDVHRFFAASGRRSRWTMGLTRRSSTRRWNRKWNPTGLTWRRFRRGPWSWHISGHLNLSASHAGHAVNRTNQGERASATRKAYP